MSSAAPSTSATAASSSAQSAAADSSQPQLLYNYQTDSKNKKCGESRQNFIDCVMEYSDCSQRMASGEASFRDCITKDRFPQQCDAARKDLYNCKRLLMDRRAQFGAAARAKPSIQ